MPIEVKCRLQQEQKELLLHFLHRPVLYRAMRDKALPSIRQLPLGLHRERLRRAFQYESNFLRRHLPLLIRHERLQLPKSELSTLLTALASARLALWRLYIKNDPNDRTLPAHAVYQWLGQLQDSILRTA